MKNKLLDSLSRIGLFLGGAIGYHIVDRVLTYRENQLEHQQQIARDEKIDEAIKEARRSFSELKDQIKSFKDTVEQMSDQTEINVLDNSAMLPDLKAKVELAETAYSIKNKSNSLMSKLSELNIPNWEKTDAYQDLSDFIKETENLTKIVDSSGKSKIISGLADFNDKFVSGLSKFYAYLDSLTLLQELSLFHIIMFSVIFIVVLNILGVLFGNEIIKYFNLEERFPKLGIFFKLRSKFQRYYLMWCVFILFTICFCCVGINILLFSIK